jgi:hypothetical protein
MIMAMKAKAVKLFSHGMSHGRAGLTAVVLVAAISVLGSGCGGSKSTTTTPTAAAPNITTFTADPSSINSGSSTTLSWSVTGATSISIGGVGAVTGDTSSVTVGTGSSVSVSPTETTAYTLTATNSVGSTFVKTTVTVNGAVVATSNCTTAGTLYTAGSGTTKVNVAVAANFASPLLFWLNNYFLSSNSNPNYTADAAAYTFEVCSDSTGNFESAIKAGTYEPDIFFAADTSVIGIGTESMEYAQGYPILMGYTSASGKSKTISGITDLLISTPALTGTHADISDTIASGGLASYTIGNLITGATPGTLVANPLLAPYGVAAVNILNATGPLVTGTPISYSPTINTSTVPSWVEALTSYGSISKAFNAIGTTSGAPTGFAAFSQICTAPPTGAVWVRFTGSDALTKQAVANLETNPGGGTEIYNLIYSEMNDSNQTWLKYITADYGYGSCYAGI